MVNIELLLKAVEDSLGRDLSAIEKFLIKGSLLSQTYSQMSKDTNYGTPHLKDVGSKLWIELSQIFGERVSKKNLKIILTNYLQENLLSYSATDKQSKLYTIGESDLSDNILGDSNFHYIERQPFEDLAYREIEIPGFLIRIFAPRKMGKTALLNRILIHAQKSGYLIAKIDLEDADLEILEDLDRLLRWLCLNIDRALGVNPELDLYWDRDMGSKVSCQLYIERHLLAALESPIVLAIDNLDLLFAYSRIAQDFLPMLRSWHERSKHSQIWQKFSLIILHSTEMYVPLRLNQSPFNIGLCLKLPFFNFEQAKELALRYELDWMIRDLEKLTSLFTLVGGHPFLLNTAFYNLSQQKISLEKLLDTAHTLEGIYANHLIRIDTILQKDPKLLAAWQKLINSGEMLKIEITTAYKLQSLGLTTIEGNLSKVNSQLFRLFSKSQNLINYNN